MVVSSRKVAALGLGLVGVGCLIGPSFGQQKQQDEGVRKTAAANPAPAAAKQAVPAPVFGTVDLEEVLRKYDKVKAQQDEFRAAAEAKRNELMKFQVEAQEESQKLAKMTPNSIDAKKIEDHLTQLKAQLEAGREQAQRDFSLRESEMLATLYKEVQSMVAAVARYKGMTYVLQVSNEPPSGSNPNSVMAAMSKTVIYSDPAGDITRDVIHNLNLTYKRAGGVAPKPAANSPAPAANPSGN
jgi:outer membrane protein